MEIGWFDRTPDWVKNAEEQRAASYHLGLPHKEVRAKVDVVNKERVIKDKYVCISVQSTTQCKYWNNPTGWDQVVEYLNSKGYKVVCIDKHASFGGRDKLNHLPKGVINKTGDFELQERITDLHNCEFFIGLGSGLSWLAWGLNKDVILISGFSNEKTEFKTPYRIINKDVCNSCWNKHKFDSGNWNWCPEHEGTDREYECSKKITFEMVKESIDRLILKREVYSSAKNWIDVFNEVIEKDIYQKFNKIKDGDLVVDLGSSRGPLYHVNRGKNITYLGVEAFKDNIEIFEKTLTPEEKSKVTILNKYFKEAPEKEVVYESSYYSNLVKSKIGSINFRQILNEVNNRKIDFLKFDIEGEEIKMFEDSYELILQNVRVMSGEVHGTNRNFTRAVDLIKRFKDDKRIDLKITSLDGIDITDKFWSRFLKETGRHQYYTEVIVHLKVL